MSNAINKSTTVNALKRTKVETTYEYVPIIGEILGFWRKAEAQRWGETMELHIKTPLEKYDIVVINGKKIIL